MDSRCVQCSKRIAFRNQRGAKLSERRCDCGGRLEIVGGNVTIYEENPFEPEKTHEWNGRRFYFTEKNRKGDLFYYQNGYYRAVGKNLNLV